MDKAKHQPVQADLMHALDFSIYDLEANRKGHLSSSQRRRIQTEGYFAIVGLLLITAMGMAGGGLAIVSGDRAQIIGGMMLVIIVSVLPSIIAFRMSRRYHDILEKSAVRTMRGVIRKQTLEPHNKSMCQFKIQMGSEDFPVNVNAFNAFVEDREYCLYIAPHLKQIFSAEPTAKYLR